MGSDRRKSIFVNYLLQKTGQNIALDGFLGPKILI